MLGSFERAHNPGVEYPNVSNAQFLGYCPVYTALFLYSFCTHLEHIYHALRVLRTRTTRTARTAHTARINAIWWFFPFAGRQLGESGTQESVYPFSSLTLVSAHANARKTLFCVRTLLRASACTSVIFCARERSRMSMRLCACLRVFRLCVCSQMQLRKREN